MASSGLRIAYRSEDFPANSTSNGYSELNVTWDDILWAAVTVGRPNRNYVFQHGNSSIFEAIFRWSLVRMSLEQSPTGRRLYRTNAARTLDPTEKGAVNYFLGLIFCKLFAAKLLNTPWLLHLDVFGANLNRVLTSRSRPDLIGQQQDTNQWHAFECKGRASKPGIPAMEKAKAQAERLVSVDGVSCSLHIGAITYFNSDILTFYWRDPPPKEGKGIEIPFQSKDWSYYYSPVTQFIGDSDKLAGVQNEAKTFEQLDLTVDIHRAVKTHLINEDWGKAHDAAVEAKREIAEAGYQPDGLLVKAGESWHRRFEKLID